MVAVDVDKVAEWATRGGALGGSRGTEEEGWSGGLGSMVGGTGMEVRSLSMVERGRKKRTMGSRKVKLGTSSVR